MQQDFIYGEEHELHGRVYDLAQPLHLGFRSWEEVLQHDDAHYVWLVDTRLAALGQRVESLNLVLGMLNTDALPESFQDFPISRLDWLKITTDVFLARLISIGDCAALLVNEIFQTGLSERGCNREQLRKKGIDRDILMILSHLEMSDSPLRLERNSRFHHGFERPYSQDYDAFRIAATFEHAGHGIGGTDRLGRPIDVETLFLEAVNHLKHEVLETFSRLGPDLETLYDKLLPRFNVTFRTLRRNGKPLPWE
ncbi:hypothetical protein QTO30_15600 [Yoonia sp. GPGPB17]|uniref:hypothetical protein n=1 Tax=Yoonia sp. GPGPB17 TaxID=3026147 RepID=UPI0030BBFFB3